jgi:geranylgeranyl diphosphate synthase, type II
MVESYLGALDFAPADGLTFDPEADGDAGGHTAGLVEAMRYSLLAGGKRIRPVLALATAESLGEPPERLLPSAAAIELVHTYSLIHDDLPAMDDDDLRRGRPTCHRVYGEDTAILAGDALFAEAVRLVCEHQEGGAETKVRILAELSGASGVHGMVGGQYLDLRDAGRASARALRRVHSLKTGRLMACAVHCGLLLARPEPPVDTVYRRFARELGLLFQIVDDILDVAGTEADLGKAVGADARRGKVTYVSVHGLEGARRLAADAHERVRAALAELPEAPATLLDLADLTYARHH